MLNFNTIPRSKDETAATLTAFATLIGFGDCLYFAALFDIESRINS